MKTKDLERYFYENSSTSPYPKKEAELQIAKPCGTSQKYVKMLKDNFKNYKKDNREEDRNKYDDVNNISFGVRGRRLLNSTLLGTIRDDADEAKSDLETLASEVFVEEDSEKQETVEIIEQFFSAAKKYPEQTSRKMMITILNNLDRSMKKTGLRVSGDTKSFIAAMTGVIEAIKPDELYQNAKF